MNDVNQADKNHICLKKYRHKNPLLRTDKVAYSYLVITIIIIIQSQGNLPGDRQNSHLLSSACSGILNNICQGPSLLDKSGFFILLWTSAQTSQASYLQRMWVSVLGVEPRYQCVVKAPQVILTNQNADAWLCPRTTDSESPGFKAWEICIVKKLP